MRGKGITGLCLSVKFGLLYLLLRNMRHSESCEGSKSNLTNALRQHIYRTDPSCWQPMRTRWYTLRACDAQAAVRAAHMFLQVRWLQTRSSLWQMRDLTFHRKKRARVRERKQTRQEIMAGTRLASRCQPWGMQHVFPRGGGTIRGTRSLKSGQGP